MFEMIIGMMGGLALFLYGMKMMSNGLELVAGNQMKTILEKLTSNKFVAIFVGIAVTALVQSSSATTVMLVTFVNSGIMTLEQVVWIIMGANIGATFTTQLVALNISDFAAIMAMLGVIMIVFIKKQKINDLGTIVAGMGILFLGMGMMSGAVGPLRTMPEFADFMMTFTNPVIGIIGGAAVTALIQSSGATIGILQAISTTGAITMSNCIYLILGTNIGTCVTAAIVSLGANRNAKRTAMIHFLYNVIGSIVFAILIQFIPFVSFIEGTSAVVKTQIANANTIYKCATTLMFIPFGLQLVKLARLVIPGNDDEEQDIMSVAAISVNQIGSATVATTALRKEIKYMLDMVLENLTIGMDGLLNHDTTQKEGLYRTEVKINKCVEDITAFMDNISTLELRHHDSEVCMSLFKISTDLERLGDHAKNLMESAGKTELNPEAMEELTELAKMMFDSFNYIKYKDVSVDISAMDALENIEDSVDMLTEQYHDLQITRLQNQQCTPEACVLYANILVDVERIFDHIMNILEESRDHHFALLEEHPAAE
ncbi:MAG: Na/Pi cotransporter family protein [Erysipelotrichaceae bacterium]|nr:Na/Pi cotransporter family protein [Erysipelotrichaceae bacterium]